MTTPTSRVWLAAVAIVLLALNLRTGISSIGVVLTVLQNDLGLSPFGASVLTALPVVFFCVIGVVAGRAIGRVGVRFAGAGVAALIAVGLAGRAFAATPTLFFVGNALLLIGIATGNILLPIAAKQYFPENVPRISAVYGAAVIGGSSLGAVLTGAVFDGSGNWRTAVGMWAVLAVMAVVPWLALVAGAHLAPANLRRSRSAVSVWALARSKRVWALVLCFGFLSAQAYAQLGWYPAILIDRGFSPSFAGAMIGLLTAAGVPATLVLPWVMRRTRRSAVVPIALGASTALGWVGVLVAPTEAPWLWSLLIGVGAGIFAWSLTMIGEHSRTADGAASLSSFTQGFGYAIAALGPFGTGALFVLTGAWTVPIAVLIAGGIVIAVTGALASRPWVVEDLGRPLQPRAKDAAPI